MSRPGPAVSLLQAGSTGSGGGPITRDGAASAAAGELSKPAYHRDDPSLTQRVLSWLWRELAKLVDTATKHAPGHGTGLFLIVALVAVLVAVVVSRVGAPRRSVRATQPLFGAAASSAVDHRTAAERFAAAGEWAQAVRERLRAISRELEQRGVVEPRPGRTADELCAEAGVALPELAAELRQAGAIFDDVWYGGRTATTADDARLRALDARVTRSRALAGRP